MLGCPDSTSTSWENDGFGNFDFAGGSAGTSHLNGSWVSYTGTFYSTGGGLHVNLPEIVVSWKQNSGARNIHITDNLGAIAQSLAYWNSPYYESFRDLSRSGQLDSLQSALDWLGSAPILGEPIDLINAGISALRGNYGAAALSLGATLPVVGWAATAVKKSDNLIDVYRAVSKAELDDIVANGLRTISGGYETGKLFAPNFNK